MNPCPKWIHWFRWLVIKSYLDQSSGLNGPKGFHPKSSPPTSCFSTIHLFRASSMFSFPTTSSTTFPLFSIHHHRLHYHYILHSNNYEKMRFVVERASLPSPSIICTIFVTRIGEPELEQFVFSMDNESDRKWTCIITSRLSDLRELKIWGRERVRDLT